MSTETVAQRNARWLSNTKRITERLSRIRLDDVDILPGGREEIEAACAASDAAHKTLLRLREND